MTDFSPEELEQYLFDLDNFVPEAEVEERTFGELLITETITCSEYWGKLINLNFEECWAKEFFSNCSNEDRRNYFLFGIKCCLSFVQSNFTGPELSNEVINFFASDMFTTVNFDKLLSVNNEDVNSNAKGTCLLVAAKTIFSCCQYNHILNTWWSWRSLLIHQLILDELSPTLQSHADRLHKEMQNVCLKGHLKAKFELEQAQLYLMYRNVLKVEAHIETAAEILGVKYELVGKLGKRTKYQESDIAQLSLEVNLLEKSDIKRPAVNDFDLPKLVAYKDDVRLDEIKFTDIPKQCILPNTEQKLILAIVREMIIAKPQDDLFYEELEPFLNLILRQKNTWAVRTVALLLKCKFESKSNRTLEHCLSQCEEVVNCIIQSEKPHPLVRVSGVWATALQPVWKLQEQYADILLNIGMIKAALILYLRLQLWEMVIVCYTILKMRHKAEEIIREQLEIKPTVKLWCLLGDATDDPSCYEKAWEMSKKRSHRAQRHWGQFFFNRKEYEKCIPHFEKSLSINPLQASVWFRLGFAALETENWQVAATAYRRYTSLEPDGFEAWNNLAQAYIKLGNKLSAHQALFYALKCSFDNWKVWENFLVVSIDTSHFSDVIRAYHRLLDLKEKYLNREALGALVHGVCNGVNDAEGCSANRVLQNTRELLGRVTSVHPGDAFIWELYASLAHDEYVTLQRLQRAFRGYTQGSWDKNPDACRQVLFVCRKMAAVVLEGDTIDAKDPILNSVRLNLSAVLTAVKKHAWENCKDLLEELTKDLSNVVEKCKKAAAATAIPTSTSTAQ